MHKELMNEIELLGLTNADLVYGSPEKKGGIRHLEEIESYKSEQHVKILFEDGCVTRSGADKVLCEHFDYGILTGGLQAGFIKMLSLAKNVANNFYSKAPKAGEASLDKPTLKSILADDDYQKLNVYIQTALPGSIGGSLGRYNNELLDDVHHTTELRLMFLAILLATTLLLWLFVYYPMTKNLNDDIMNTNSMMLMIPPETIRQNPSIREFMLKFAKQN